MYRGTYIQSVLEKFKTRDIFGIVVFSVERHNVVLNSLRLIGYEQAVIRQWHGPITVDMFSLLQNSDVVVILNDIRVDDYEVFVLDKSDEVELRKKIVYISRIAFKFLKSHISTNIRGVIPLSASFNQIVVVGIGGNLKGFPNWYGALETLASETLFSIECNLNKVQVVNYFSMIGCAIPGCFGYTPAAKYWHTHGDDDFPSESTLNSKYSSKRIGVEYGEYFSCVFKGGGRIMRAVYSDINYKEYIEPMFRDGPISVPSGTVPYLVRSLSTTLHSEVDNFRECHVVGRVESPIKKLVSELKTLILSHDSGPAIIACVSTKASFKSTFLRSS